MKYSNLEQDKALQNTIHGCLRNIESSYELRQALCHDAKTKIGVS